MAQRVGPVVVTEEDVADECTVLTVPQVAVGFVTGKGGNFLRTLEDEHGTLMFFADQEGVERQQDENDLMIFGTREGRRGAQLAVMGVVEMKVKGYYTDSWREKGSTYDRQADLVGDWGTSTMELTTEELPYAIGTQGKTRKKLAWNSGAIVQYVDNVVFMSGTKEQRERAKELMQELLEQRDSNLQRAEQRSRSPQRQRASGYEGRNEHQRWPSARQNRSSWDSSRHSWPEQERWSSDSWSRAAAAPRPPKPPPSVRGARAGRSPTPPWRKSAASAWTGRW